jgi:hypothetical protein
MSYFTYNPFGNQAIVLGWNCIKCQHYIVSDELSIPQPDYMADNSRESQTEEDHELSCPNCAFDYNIYLYSSFGGGNGDIPELPDDYVIDVVEIEEPYDEEQYEAIVSNTKFFETFITEISNIRKLNEHNFEINSSMEESLRRQIFVGVIATMETYLSDAFINTTLSSLSYKEKFVKSFKDFKDKSFPLSDLFEKYNDIDNICKKALLDVMFHNLAKVKGMYSDTLNVDLGNISEAAKAIQIRHHLVHRNGKDKDGKHFIVTKEVVSSLLDNIEEFISKVDEQVSHL